jgi:hypothetical protein
MNSMVSRREGQSDFLDKVTDQVATAESEGTKKVASTNHPAEKAATESSAVAKTNHPSEKASSDTTVKKVADEKATEKTATEATEEKTADVAEPEAISLHQARVARRQGKFVKVAGRNDLYQEANTDNYWKISEDKSKVVRAFNESNGLVTK